jgi:RNA polymerase-associated protein RTF1
MLARKAQLQSGRSAGSTTAERSRLNAARTLALRRNDPDEVKEIDEKLAELSEAVKPRHTEDSADLLTKVNERNRKANTEAVRRAELAEVERKRRERKLAAAGTAVPVLDPSARLKTVPRLFNSATPTPSRFVLSFPPDFYFS